jgi:hypothetical protein
MSFDAVFVPGLAERLFPRKIVEDPIILDSLRAELNAGLATNEQRLAQERLALGIAVGAAERRLYLSYPRLDLQQGRPRVPSFYALETIRAAEVGCPILLSSIVEPKQKALLGLAGRPRTIQLKPSTTPNTIWRYWLVFSTPTQVNPKEQHGTCSRPIPIWAAPYERVGRNGAGTGLRPMV